MPLTSSDARIRCIAWIDNKGSVAVDGTEPIIKQIVVRGSVMILRILIQVKAVLIAIMPNRFLILIMISLEIIQTF